MLIRPFVYQRSSLLHIRHWQPSGKEHFLTPHPNINHLNTKSVVILIPCMCKSLRFGLFSYRGHVECGGKHPPITITRHTKHYWDEASVEVVLKCESNALVMACGFNTRCGEVTKKKAAGFFFLWAAASSQHHMLTGAFSVMKLVNVLLPDVAYQPSLCAVAEGGPNLGARSPNSPGQWSWKLFPFFTISPRWKTFPPYKTKLSTEKKGGVIRQGYLTVSTDDVPLFHAQTHSYAKRHSINLTTQ